VELNSPKTRIILTGVSGFDLLPALPSVAANLTDLEEALRAPHGTAFAAGIDVVPDPGRPGVVSKLLQSAATADLDVLFFYYSGHGLLDDQQQLHLAVVESDPEAVPETALAFSRVRRIISQSSARVKVVVLDCCFSGRAIESGMSDVGSLVDGQLELRGAFTLASSAADLPSLAPVGLRNTAFTEALLLALREGVPGGSESLLLGEVAGVVHRHLSRAGRPTPRLRADGTAAGLVLAANPAFGRGEVPVTAPVAPRPPVMAPGQAAAQWMAELERALTATLAEFRGWSVNHLSVGWPVANNQRERFWEASLCPGGNHAGGGRCPRGIPVRAVYDANPGPAHWRSHSSQVTLLAPQQAGLIVSSEAFPLEPLRSSGTGDAARIRRGWETFMGGMSRTKAKGASGNWIVHWPGEEAADEASRRALDTTVRELVEGAVRERRWWRRLIAEL
jgi:hypothetical protein